jgi:hypothetical protein
MSQQFARVVAACVISPLVPAFILYAIAFLILVFTGDKDALSSTTLFAAIALGTGYPFALLVMAPLHLVFRRYGFVRLWHYILAGAIAGAVIGWIPWLIGPGSFTGGRDVGAVWGLVSAALFWLIVRPKIEHITSASKPLPSVAGCS